MRILFASFAVMALACGSSPKKETSIVQEGSDVPTTCCCKTIPVTAEKEIIPVYTMQGRMECSTSNGECVPDVQCNGHAQPDQQKDTGVPPPPVLAPQTNDTIQ